VITALEASVKDTSAYEKYTLDQKLTNVTDLSVANDALTKFTVSPEMDALVDAKTYTKEYKDPNDATKNITYVLEKNPAGTSYVFNPKQTASA